MDSATRYCRTCRNRVELSLFLKSNGGYWATCSPCRGRRRQGRIEVRVANRNIAEGANVIVPIARQPNISQVTLRHEIGHMTYECTHCKAQHWLEERVSSSTLRNPEYPACCAKGKVQLPEIRSAPPELLKLFTANDQGTVGLKRVI